jgi:hypothetical protein
MASQQWTPLGQAPLDGFSSEELKRVAKHLGVPNTKVKNLQKAAIRVLVEKTIAELSERDWRREVLVEPSKSVSEAWWGQFQVAAEKEDTWEKVQDVFAHMLQQQTDGHPVVFEQFFQQLLFTAEELDRAQKPKTRGTAKTKTDGTTPLVTQNNTAKSSGVVTAGVQSVHGDVHGDVILSPREGVQRQLEALTALVQQQAAKETTREQQYAAREKEHAARDQQQAVRERQLQAQLQRLQENQEKQDRWHDNNTVDSEAAKKLDKLSVQMAQVEQLVQTNSEKDKPSPFFIQTKREEFLTKLEDCGGQAKFFAKDLWQRLWPLVMIVFEQLQNMKSEQDHKQTMSSLLELIHMMEGVMLFRFKAARAGIFDDKFWVNWKAVNSEQKERDFITEILGVQKGPKKTEKRGTQQQDQLPSSSTPLQRSAGPSAPPQSQPVGGIHSGGYQQWDRPFYYEAQQPSGNAWQQIQFLSTQLPQPQQYRPSQQAPAQCLPNRQSTPQYPSSQPIRQHSQPTPLYATNLQSVASPYPATLPSQHYLAQQLPYDASQLSQYDARNSTPVTQTQSGTSAGNGQYEQHWGRLSGRQTVRLNGVSYCANCAKPGCSTRDCPEDRQLRCWKCLAPGVRASECNPCKLRQQQYGGGAPSRNPQ